MNRLSQRFSRWYHQANHESPGTPPYSQVVIVGSGYGGSVAALRYAELGYQVTVLERGSEFVPGEFPADMSALPTFFRINNPTGTGVIGRSAGLLNWHVGLGMAAMTGNGLGGGSLINAGIMIEPVREVFGLPQWPAAIGKTGARDGADLDACFKRAREKLLKKPGREPISNATVDSTGLNRSDAFRDMATRCKLADQVKPVEATIDPEHCIRCGDCMTGCNIPGAKLTLADTYLAHAVELGCGILCGADVQSIEQDIVSGQWNLHVHETEHSDLKAEPGKNDTRSRLLKADIVVLSAGAFGSTEILQRSREKHGLVVSQALGTRVSANGDSITVIANYGERRGGRQPKPVKSVSRPTPIDQRATDIGPTITLSMDMRGSGALQTQLLVEDGACPAPLARAFDALVSTQWVSSGLDQFRSPKLNGREFNGLLSDVMGAPSSLGDQSQILLTMGHDGSAGRIMWMPELNRAVPVWSSPQKLTTYRSQQALFRRMDKSLKEARHLHNPLWQMLPESAGAMQGGLPEPMITTVHPLGGCVMGDNFDTSVVNEHGQVRRSESELHDGLFVLDGSIIPTSLGCNPLLTITALAEYAMRAVKPAPLDQARRVARLFTPEPAIVAPVETRPLNEPAVAAVFYERLTCTSLEPGQELAEAIGIKNRMASAELILGFGHPDWDSAMSGADHELNQITGTLKIQNHADKADQQLDNNEPVIHYRLAPGEDDADRSRFIILSGHAVDPSLNTLHRRLARLALGIPTYLVQRLIPDLVRSRQLAQAGPGSQLLHSLGNPESRILRYSRLASDAMRLLWNASEARQMRYQLRFEPEPGHPDTARLPRLWITGHKQVQYAASPGDLWRYSVDLGQRLWHWYRNAIPAETHRSVVLKRSYIEQVSNPQIDFHLGPPQLRRWQWLSSRPAASGQFLMDPYSVMQDKPPQVGPDGDLTSAIATLSNYPALFARFALKTRLFDFRAPDYSNQTYRDESPAEETTLFNRDNQPPGGRIDAEPIDIEVDRGYHAAEDSRFASNKITLRLWRYRLPAADKNGDTAGPPNPTPFVHGRHNGRPVLRARCVLLLHAFSQSGLTYTFNTTRQNLAEAFIEAGYEVWLLESRMSTRLGLCDQASTVDQIARFDVPGAVNRITTVLRDEYISQAVLQDGEQVQIGCFGQCIGSASLAMSLLSGQLNHPQSASGEPLSKLWACLFSQVHPITIGARESQAKSWIPPVLRLATNTVPFAVRGPVDNPVEALTDRVLAALPVPADETCPEHSNFSAHEDNMATCRRIRFIEAPLFKHRNVNAETHGILNKLFGNANLTLFAHARRFVDYELLVDENGVNRYVTTGNIRSNMAMPVAFLHGTVNELFDPDSARRSLEIIRNVHPYWIQQFAPEVIPANGYGHIDPLIGTNADTDVYPRITGFFSSVLRTVDQDDSYQATQPKPLTELRYPRIGPTLGWTRLDSHGDLLCRISGVVQMNSRAAIQADANGTSAWAYVHGMRNAQDTVQQLTIDRSSDRTHVAWGDVRVDAARIAPGSSAVRIHLVVIHDTGHWSERSRMNRRDLVRLMWHQRKQARAARRRMQAPVPATHSRRYSAHPGSASSFAGTEAVWRRPVVVRRTVIDNLSQPSSAQSVVIGCCRYPGIGMDRIRADEAFGRVLDILDDGPAAVTQSTAASEVPSELIVSPGLMNNSGPAPAHFQAPCLALMLGDQIYADATAGLVDPATPVERYTERYESAFGVGKSPQMARLLRTLPVMMTPDDHEYHNGFPHEPSSASGDHEAAIHMARSTLNLFQSIFNPNGKAGNYAFDHGHIRFCVLDTRSDRSEDPDTGQIHITAPGTMQWLENELQSVGPDRLVLVCTGSVVVPGLRDDGSPSNPIAVREGFEVARDEQRELLQLCVRHAAGRFALISGDYHIGSVVELTLHGQTVGCAIVAPPFYAPFRYINAQPYEVLEHDTIDLGDLGMLQVSPGSTPDGKPAQCNGSGFGLVQTEWHDGRWQIRVGMQLNHYEQFTGWSPLYCAARVTLSAPEAGNTGSGHHA